MVLGDSYFSLLGFDWPETGSIPMLYLDIIKELKVLEDFYFSLLGCD